MPQRANEQATALALVVIFNWLLSHDATSWVMPPEVQSSLQSLISFVYGSYLDWRGRRGAAADAEAHRVLATPATGAAG